jgi:hypothetical protein
MNMIELPFCRVCYHHINIDAINESMNERIKKARGGGGGGQNPKVLKKYQKELIGRAKRHNDLHSDDEKLSEIEIPMFIITKTYSRDGLSGAERYDREYTRLQERKNRIENNNNFTCGSDTRDSLMIDWGMLKQSKNPLLTEGGNDSQHDPCIYQRIDPNRFAEDYWIR